MARNRIAAGHRIFGWDHRDEIVNDAGELAINMTSDHVFGFLDEESEGSSFGSNNNGDDGEYELLEEEDNDNNKEEREISSTIENKNFWESQNQLLHGTLCRTSSIETKIRNITKEVVKEAADCICGKVVGSGCRSCLMKDICFRLQNSGFLNTSICKSKWKTSPDIPSGEHTFVETVDNSKKGQVRVIIELNFRAEFEMARASDEYNELIKRLPEVFVGKTERLLSLIKIVCSAAKKCMKDKKMHLGPWRKQRYMQAKWFRVCERTTTPAPLSTGKSSLHARPRALSMLTVDLLENLPNVHRTGVVAVVY